MFLRTLILISRSIVDRICLSFKKSIGNCLQVPPSQWGIPIVTPRFIKHMHALDKKVHVWTIDDKEEMQRLYDLRVDGIMTDKPSVLKEFLESKNLL